jgi:glycosyltransferase 2 family protein
MVLAGKLVGAAVLSLVLWLSLDLGQAATALARADPVLVWGAFAASVLNVLISARKWQSLLSRAGIPLIFDVVAQLYWIGAFFSNFLPTGVGGDAVRLMLAPVRNRRGTVAGTILIERLSGLFVMLLLSALGLAFLHLELGDALVARMSMATVVGSAGAVAAVLLAPGLFVATLARANGLLPPAFRAPLGAAHRIAAQVMAPAGDRVAVAVAVSYSLPFYAAVILAQYCVLRAVGADIGLLEVASGAPLICAVTFLPVTVNGLFLAEGAFVLVYASVGVAPEMALAAAILRRLVDLGNSGLGGLLWLAWQVDPAQPARPGVAAEERQAVRSPYASLGRQASAVPPYRIGGRVVWEGRFAARTGMEREALSIASRSRRPS